MTTTTAAPANDTYVMCREIVQSIIDNAVAISEGRFKAFRDDMESCLTKNDDFNIQSKKGAKFNVQNAKRFMAPFVKYQHWFSEQSYLKSMIFRAPKDNIAPFYCDIDLLLKKDYIFPSHIFIKMGHELLKVLYPLLDLPEGAALEVLMTRRKQNREDKDGFHSGFHLMITNLPCRKAVTIKLREELLKHDPFFKLLKGYTCEMDREKIVDTNVARRASGLFLIGCNKPNVKCSPHYIFYRDQWRLYWMSEPNTFVNGKTPGGPVTGKTPGRLVWNWQHKSQRIKEWYINYLCEVYKFIFTPLTDEIFLKAQSVTEVEEKQHTETPVNSNFNLKLFLDITRNKKLPHGDWKQLLLYCRIQGMNKQFVCHTLNGAYNPADQKENARLWDSYTGDNAITKGSIKRLLGLYATKGWDERELFGVEEYKYKFYQDRVIFRQKPPEGWALEEIHRFFREVFRTTWGNGRTSFVYFEQKSQSYGDTHRMITGVVMRDDIPFSKTQDMIVYTRPTVSDLVKQVEKIINKVPSKENLQKHIQATKLLADIEKIPKDSQYNKLIAFLGPQPPKKNKMGRLFKDYLEHGELDEYHRVDCVPYYEKDGTAPDVLNCFQGFALKNEDPGNIDVKQTALYQWLYTAWCNKEPAKMHWLLSFFHKKMRYPHLKTRKILVSFSRLTGTGQSTMEKFLKKIYGENYVLFLDSLDELLGQWTGQQLGRLFILVDDIEKATKKTSTALRSLITAGHFRYRVMHQNPKRMSSFFDLVCSSNSRTPVFVGEYDRRSEMIEINPSLKADTRFWVKLNAELDDIMICSAWFQYIANYETHECNPSLDSCRFSKQSLTKMKLRNMKSTHRFLMRFFEDEKFAFRSCTYCDRDWFNFLKFLTRKSIGNYMIVTKERLWDWYKWWVKNAGEKCAVKQSNFYEDLELLNLRESRKVFLDGIKRCGFTLSQSIVKDAIQTFLSAEDGAIKLQWCTEDPEVWGVLKKNVFPEGL